jgi:hypothetical protein
VHSRTDRDLTRVLIASATLASVALGTAFHAAAGGGLPGWFALVTIAALAWWPTSSALTRTRSPAAVAMIVAAGQAFVHVALTATAGHGHGASHAHSATGPPATMASTGAAPGTLAAQLGADGLPPSAVGVDPVALAIHRVTEEISPDHAAMSLAHIAAGLLVGAWLAWGAHALRGAACLLAPIALLLSLRPSPVERLLPTRACTISREPFVLRSQHRVSVAGRRGPPRLLAHALLPVPAV